MKTFVMGLLLCGALLAGAAQAADVDCQRFGGAIKIPTDKNSALRQPLKGKMVDGNIKIFSYEGGLAGGRNISVQADFINTANTKMSYTMGVAFFDDRNELVAATGKTEVFSVDAGKSGSCNLEISCPRAVFYKISTYQLVFYDDPQTIGKQ